MPVNFRNSYGVLSSRERDREREEEDRGINGEALQYPCRMTCRGREGMRKSADEICLLNSARKVCFGESDVSVCQQQQQGAWATSWINDGKIESLFGGLSPI